MGSDPPVTCVPDFFHPQLRGEKSGVKQERLRLLLLARRFY
jgi:hypothetical protein